MPSPKGVVGAHGYMDLSACGISRFEISSGVEVIHQRQFFSFFYKFGSLFTTHYFSAQSAVNFYG